jgi:primosomal protein N' (replication factor Y)
MKEPKYAQVILETVSDALDKPFQYTIPVQFCRQLKPGWRVSVPFRSKKITGYVVQTGCQELIEEPKEILRLQDDFPLLSQELVDLSSWLSRRFFSRWIEAIRLCLPPATGRVRSKFQEYIFPAVNMAALSEESKRIKKSALRQALILEYLSLVGNKGVSWGELRKKTGASRPSLVSLAKKGFLRIERTPLERTPWDKIEYWQEIDQKELVFSEQQGMVWKRIQAGFASSQKHFLIHGVSGSGKTELYLRTAEDVLERGRTVLILVPEIALAPQMIAQFRGRFQDQFALLHSSLSPGERYDQWWKVKRGEAKVVLGTRSAVFAPLQNIGLVVMDEEHENTYKQDDPPRYHTFDVAQWRAVYNNALLLLGSATPSLETYWRSHEKKIKLLNLTKRIAERPLPTVRVVDMREEFKHKNRSIFSRELLAAIRETILRDEQMILFLNRRGFAGFQLCRECGYVLQCPSCTVSLTYHSSPEHLQCHFCGYRRPVTPSCPRCQSGYIRNFGLGTQRVEKEIKNIFPNVKVIRMDSDSTTGKEAHLKKWNTFRKKGASILIGTQMVAKGLDFPDVTLVGVIAADLTLHLPDFRAGERTFQLLTQVAGRAGRGQRKGQVIIQTYAPWHYSVKAAANHSYQDFIAEEYKRRRLLLYPPFAEIILFGCSSPEDVKARESAQELRERLHARLPCAAASGEEMVGPFPAPLQKVKGHYRYHILLKGENLQQYGEIIRETVWNFRIEMGTSIRVIVDFNPSMML